MGLNRVNLRGKAQMNYLEVDAARASSNAISLNADEAQAEVIKFTGTLGAGTTLQMPVYPADAGRVYLMWNGGTSQTITIKGYTADGGTTPTTGLALANNGIKLVVWNGTDFVAYTLT